MGRCRACVSEAGLVVREVNGEILGKICGNLSRVPRGKGTNFSFQVPVPVLEKLSCEIGCKK